MATIGGRCLFHSELPIVLPLFEGGVYLKKFGILVPRPVGIHAVGLKSKIFNECTKVAILTF